MKVFSTRAAAKELGIPAPTLFHYIRIRKIPRPKSFTAGENAAYLWSEKDIERVRKILPKIANGRKTRYQKLRDKEKTQPRAAALRKTKKLKK